MHGTTLCACSRSAAPRLELALPATVTSDVGEQAVVARADRPDRPAADLVGGVAPGAPAGPVGLLALGAAVGLAVMAATSSGDTLAAGFLLGLAATDLCAGVTGVLVGVAVAGRWGAFSFSALAGGQAVVGPAGWSGTAAMVVSSWAAAAAVLLVCPRRPRRSGAAAQSPARQGSGAGVPPAGALASGLVAAALVAGPAVGRATVSVVALRAAASAIGTIVAVLVVRAVPPRRARVMGLIAAAAAASVALLA